MLQKLKNLTLKKPTTVVLWHKNECVPKLGAYSCKIIMTITKTRCWGWLDHSEEARPDKIMSLKSPQICPTMSTFDYFTTWKLHNTESWSKLQMILKDDWQWDETWIELNKNKVHLIHKLNYLNNFCKKKANLSKQKKFIELARSKITSKALNNS